MFYGREPRRKEGRMPIFCVHPVLFSWDMGREAHIHLQERSVINPAYDPLGNGKWETIGETLKPMEDFEGAVHRGIAEECGYSRIPDSPPWLILDQGGRGIERWQYWHGKEREETLSFDTRITLVTEGSQPWLSIAFLVEVGADFQTKPDKEGETGEHIWVPVSELTKALKDPNKKFRGHYFMPLSVPAFKYACERLFGLKPCLI